MSVIAGSIETGSENGMFKRLVEAGLAAKSFGEVESCTGKVQLVEIPEDGAARAAMRAMVFGNDAEEEWMTDALFFDALDSGWYFALSNSDGFIFYECESKEAAVSVFENTVTNYEPFDIW